MREELEPKEIIADIHFILTKLLELTSDKYTWAKADVDANNGVFARLNSFIMEVRGEVETDRNSRLLSPLTPPERNVIFSQLMLYRLVRNLKSLQVLYSGSSLHISLKEVDFSSGIIIRSNLNDIRILGKIMKGETSFLKVFCDGITYVKQGLLNRFKDIADNRNVEIYSRLALALDDGKEKEKRFYSEEDSSLYELQFLNVEALYDLYSKYDHFTFIEASCPLMGPDVNRLKSIVNSLRAHLVAFGYILTVLNGFTEEVEVGFQEIVKLYSERYVVS